MEFFKRVDYIKESRKNKLIVIFLLLFAIVIPLTAFIEFLKPSNELIEIWFQRTGSIVVLLGSIAEYFSIRMHNVFSPTLLANEPTAAIRIKYSLQAKRLMAISAVFICFGTIIWGYGDLIILNL